MASTFSNNLRIELIAVGEQANTWGGTTNNNLGTLLEQAISGGVAVDVTAGNVTLTALDGASDQSRPMVIRVDGTPGVTRTITAPAKGKVYIVYNTSDASINFIASGSILPVTIISGAKKFIYCDSVNFYEAINALTVTSGTIDGTTIGATTATTGRFTTVNASGQVTSTVTTGTAPFVVASTTAVANLTASNVTTNADLTGMVTSSGSNVTTVVTNANLSGAVISSGSNVTSLGSFTSAQLATALTNETGSGSAVFSVSPTFTGTVNTAALTAAGAVTITGATNTAALTAAGAVTITGAFALRGSYGAGADASSFAAGDRALDSNTTGSDNTAVGVDALTANTTGNSNVAVGFYALKSNTVGVYNVGVGYALIANTTGSSNTAIGGYALSANTTGQNNTSVGGSSMLNSTTGSNNTAVGSTALSDNTTGTFNTSMGVNSLTSNTNGSFNTAIGDYALSNNTTGSYNTAVGDDAGLGLTTGSYNQVFGNGITLGTASTGRIGIGSSFTHGVNTSVIIGNGTNRISNAYTVNATWAFSSDERLKNVIGKDTLGLTFINDLEPVTYRWKPSNEIPKELTAHYAEENVQDTNVVMHGLIAQNVKAALDKAGVDTFTGWSEDEDGTQRLGMADLITPMINAIKELTARLEALEGKL